MSSKDNRPLVIEDPIVIPLKQKCRGVSIINNRGGCRPIPFLCYLR